MPDQYTARSAGNRRVVLVTNGLVRAGTETQTVRLAGHLRAEGDEVGILSILPTAAFADELQALGIPVAHVRLRRRLRALTSIVDGWRVLRQWQPDALVSFSYQANLLGRIAGVLAGVPVRISSMRNERFGGRARELLHRVTEPLATATTVNSALAAESLVRRKVVPAGRLQVIPNGVDLAAVEAGAASRPEARRELGVGEGEFLWLAVGRLHPQKDHATLLRAFARLVAEHPSARLCLVGEGPLLADLEVLVSGLGVETSVSFAGVRDDVPRLLAAADALVLSSAWEGLPNAVMEAMVAELPVVATRVGGVPELVDDGRTGYLVRPGDPDALWEGLARMTSLPPSERAAMGERGRSAIRERFPPEQAARQWVELLERSLHEAQRRRGAGGSRRQGTRPPMLAR